ncbi:MAG: cob(I)yrinic acid a,c-diamide adenosyltransferase [Ignavibacteria bacterium]|nr:cob(I)yrinic acid a,c-diamide adenosyltransferase [Ignavibacteria bacterium]
MKIYTKTGDKGETSLFDGTKVLKSDPRVESYGTIDELNSYIGLLTTLNIPDNEKKVLTDISYLLFRIGTDLATPLTSKIPKNFKRVDKDDILYLEKLIDKYSDHVPELSNFILPGGSFESAYIHIARTVCRRSERKIVELFNKSEINENIIVVLNRLSDFLFVLARYINYIKGVADVIWK